VRTLVSHLVGGVTRVALAGYVRELLARGWDLATATGQPAELDQELAAFALEVSRRSLPAWLGREQPA
jgi:hypothetical protein